MNVRELFEVLERLVAADPRNWKKEIRIGDQIESGPYLHASVGGVFRGEEGQIIICANDDDRWKDESVTLQDGQVLSTLWKPPG